MTVFSFATASALWLGLALLQGIGAAAAGRVANLFVVEAHPQVGWDDRIGWLQTFYGGGKVGGLLLAGLLGHAHPRIGLLVASALTALAVLPGWYETQSPFGLFLLAWLLSFAGSAAVFSLYPVLMKQTYGVSPRLSSLGFGVAAGLDLVLDSPAGRWSGRRGPARLLKIALGVRLLAFLSLLALGVTHSAGQRWLALLAFLFVVLAWPLLGVSGTVADWGRPGDEPL